MNKSCIAALTAASMVGPANTLAADNAINIDSAKYRLGNPACGVSESEWKLSSGPSSALVTNTGDNSYVEFFEPGNYEFSHTCCETTAANNGQGYGSPLERVNALMASPDRMGYGRNTTGGADATEYTVVTSLADSGSGTLRDALDSDTPVWIIFDESIHGGTIELESTMNIHTSDFTIDGAGADITLTLDRSDSFVLLALRGGNAIVHGLSFDGNNTRSSSLMIREGDNYWVDHITITGNIFDDGLTVGMGSRDTSATDVTVSNYHAHDTKYAFLSGGDDKVERHPVVRTTIHSSVLSADDRNPRIKNYGNLHLFNNYIHSFKYVGANSGANSTIFSESNVFSASNANNPKNALAGGTNNGGELGVVYSDNDIFLDVASTNSQVIMTNSSEFNLPYEYAVMPANQVVEHVLANAGAANANDPNTTVSSATGSDSSVSCAVNTRSLNYNIGG